MTEHQRETAFLKHIIVYDDSEERRRLEETIAQVQRDGRCVQRAARLMALFTVLGVAGLGYGAVLQDNFPYGKVRLVNELIFALALASLVCLAAFLGLLVIYRSKLNRLREECRRMVTKLLESHWGKPYVTPVRGDLRGGAAPEVAQGAWEVNGSPAPPDSLPRELATGGN